MTTLAKKPLKKPPTKNINIHNSKCSPAVEKHILGALVKCRDNLYSPLFKLPENDKLSKEKEPNSQSNSKAAYIASQIMSNCPKELQDLNCTVFFLTKGGGFQLWGNYKHYVSASFGNDEDIILIVLN